MAERRRSRSWWLKAIVDDPYRKLMAIGLAVMLWFFINSHTTGHEARRLTLEVVGPNEEVETDYDHLAVHLPTDRVAPKNFYAEGRKIGDVTVVLTGPRYRVEAVKEQVLNLAVLTFRDWHKVNGDREADKSVEMIEFTASDIARDVRALQGMRVELEPPRVRLELERVANLTIPLNDPASSSFVKIVADDLEDRLIYDSAVYRPDMATVLGPAIGMAQLEKRPPPYFRVALKAAASETTASAELEIIGGDDLGVYLQPKPRLTIELRPQTDSYVLELPILVNDLSLPIADRGRYRPEFATLAVGVQVAGNLRRKLFLLKEDRTKLQQWAAENLHLEVYVRRPDSGGSYPDEINPKLYLVPAGALLLEIERGECLLVDDRTVKLQRRKP